MLKILFMLIIKRHNTDPYFNLATEEYVLREITDDSFMLWRNSPCIIVGKHQNTLAEINVEYIKHNNIPVVRRLAGGGAVERHRIRTVRRADDAGAEGRRGRLRFLYRAPEERSGV